MQDIHREAIRKNFSSLVEQTDLDIMVSALHEKGVFSDTMIEPYRDQNKAIRDRKRLLYRNITMRGPEAFGKLLDALSENGYWGVVRDLDPTSALHVPNRLQPNSIPEKNKGHNDSFLSIPEKKKEHNDLNKNRLKSQIPSTSKMEPKNHRDEELNGNNTAESSSSMSRDPANNTALPSNESRLSTDSDPLSKIPRFNVIKSTKFFDSEGKDLHLYRTRSRRRGIFFMFTYISFENNVEEYRAGAARDADNLRYLFLDLGFKVISYCNLKYEETIATFRKLKEVCKEVPECLFVVFSSHGYPHRDSGDIDIRCSDGRLMRHSKIIDNFDHINFPELKNIPKVFIFQNCRGDKSYFTESAGMKYDGGPYRDADNHEQTRKDLKDRSLSDILVVNSTVPGHVSNRDEVHGSWFIQALCDVFEKRAHDCHVVQLFRLVDEELKRRFGAQTSSVDSWGFNRLLYLHPGLYED